MCEFSVESFPVIELNSFVSIGLEDLDEAIGKFDNHADVIVLTVGHQSLQGTFGVIGFHE